MDLLCNGQYTAWAATGGICLKTYCHRDRVWTWIETLLCPGQTIWLLVSPQAGEQLLSLELFDQSFEGSCFHISGEWKWKCRSSQYFAKGSSCFPAIPRCGGPEGSPCGGGELRFCVPEPPLPRCAPAPATAGGHSCRVNCFVGITIGSDLQWVRTCSFWRKREQEGSDGKGWCEVSGIATDGTVGQGGHL